ncbi:unnamed protein product [Nezara viridula]|uniref:Uncharacterized protein n=1 Tax=Nezara viridula TaxID=85310 RepID=A0A9P0E3D9_NEZVI|nr:unnamed protein product [Nezara viridula]
MLDFSVLSILSTLPDPNPAFGTAFTHNQEKMTLERGQETNPVTNGALKLK